ncbi:MurR/RpiR family transcriptional regulator [Listeria costaricensis]|uniref:MurR/RpiR family transcriptional regulator n=1 Tax=Listeria costaricensis TaxID=2026604 RepID=UPI000C072738|nr:MurR/RpiR family transcriptional regulator [Listeria costaricensis]
MKLEELVNRYYDRLNENDLHIWTYIRANKEKCCSMSINDLAAACNVSRTTILRFAKKISFDGYSELKVHIKLDLEKGMKMENDSVELIAEGYTRTIEEISKKDFLPICRLIHQAKRVFIFGSGDYQMAVARQLKRLFLHGGDCFYDFDAITLNKEFFNIVEADDLVILISLDGESENVVSVARQLKLMNVAVISISKLKNSTLATLSKENIYIKNTSIHFDNKSSQSFESTASLYLVAELLFVKYNLYKNQRIVAENEKKEPGNCAL